MLDQLDPSTEKFTSPTGLSTSGIMLVGPNSFTLSSTALDPVTIPTRKTRYI